MKPKIFVFDIETAPITSYTWGTRKQNISLNQIKKDWHLLAWAGLWYGDPKSKVIYRDTSKQKDISDDKKLVKELCDLLSQADIILTQNGDKFDVRKLNARAAIHKLPPYKKPKSTDTYKESKKVFGFTFHSLEYMASILNVKYKKLKHPKFPGQDLWNEVLKNNKEAWAEMKKYCINDVFTTEELYKGIQGWIKTQNLSCYFDDAEIRCRCGSNNLSKDGFVYTDAGKFQGYICKDCNKRPHGKTNLLSTEKKMNLLKD